jgi:hypothetical protein
MFNLGVCNSRSRSLNIREALEVHVRKSLGKGFSRLAKKDKTTLPWSLGDVACFCYGEFSLDCKEQNLDWRKAAEQAGRDANISNPSEVSFQSAEVFEPTSGSSNSLGVSMGCGRVGLDLLAASSNFVRAPVPATDGVGQGGCRHAASVCRAQPWARGL